MSRKPKDLTGQKFGKLTVKEYAGKVGKYPGWWCKCECGKTFIVSAYIFHQKQAVGCPFCQTHAVATSIIWQGQRITIIPHNQYKNASIEYLGELVKQLTNNSEANAILVMLEDIPDEALQGLGSELEDSVGEGDSADSAAEEWIKSASYFDKPVDTM